MATIHVRVVDATLKYEAVFSAPAFSIFDQPGRIYEALLAELRPFDASAEDLSMEGDQPGERAIVCSLENVAITVRPDRLEIAISEWIIPRLDEAARVIEAAWQALASVHSTPVVTQSVEFELSLELLRESYKSVLERFAPSPAAFPNGTETAVVFYLPGEPDKGYRDSNLLLNRSENDGGLSCTGMLVYNGDTLKPGSATRAAWRGMTEMLDKLDFGLCD